MGFRVLLPLMVLTSCFIINAFGHDDLDLVSWTQAPHHAPSYPPTGAPPPHHHHKPPGGGHHHHKPAVPPTAHPPTVAPVHPPTKAPVAPPTKTPVKPPTKAPVAPVKPPTKAPVAPPTKAPVKPPTKAPVKPPSHSPAPAHGPLPTRRQVAIRGVVYCKACKYKGVDTLVAATPLQGAVVLLTCNNTKYPLRTKATTDKNGFFFIMPPKTLTTYGVHKCKVTLLSSPKATCNQPTNLHYGLKGATLVPTPKPHGSSLSTPPLPFDVFTVGPFAFEASKKIPCTH
ncbi:hypothetical protein OSB04_001832 [Centaurea solstitialis]|uniref:Uncharacterized protein n=1 Tax=Centaurea solstitialis TaxID=347529 RepID=A0AA38WV34_9ASTR|nr:hypothetical protein OSB04_001832 [Centaurea solstitialis]